MKVYCIGLLGLFACIVMIWQSVELIKLYMEHKKETSDRQKEE